MTSMLYSAMMAGTTCQFVRIEGNFLRGFSGLQLIGNPSDTCRDGKDRALGALEALNFKQPAKRILINLAPAESKKSGNQFDLAIAVLLALMFEPERFPNLPRIERWVFAAELGIDGALRPARGILPFFLAAEAHGFEGMIVESSGAAEIELLLESAAPELRSLTILTFDMLEEVLHWLAQGMPLSGGVAVRPSPSGRRVENFRPAGEDPIPLPEPRLNYDDMLLDEETELLIATIAVGRHHCMLQGAPGTGKSMLASRLPSVLPKLEGPGLMELMLIHSHRSGGIPADIAAGRRPFRAPHSSSSMQALVGSEKEPGELSLAHGGVLLLDELPEFRRDLVEALRGPLEAGRVHVSRAKYKAVWPAHFILIATRNHCPCGYYGSNIRPCHCPVKKIQAYQARVSGPLAERIDIHHRMPERSPGSGSRMRPAASAALSQKIARALSFGKARSAEHILPANRDLSLEQLRSASGLDAKHYSAMLNRCLAAHLSTRCLTKVLRIARTLADLCAREAIVEADLEQALRWQPDAA